jgi:hypothetical protein
MDDGERRRHRNALTERFWRYFFRIRRSAPDKKEQVPAMTRPKAAVQLIGDINPSQIYPTTLGPAIWGLGWQATKNKVASGQLPRPSPLTPGSNREGWFGFQILEHRSRMQTLAAEKAATNATRLKQKQPAAFQKKIKKVKLRAPARAGA